MEPLRWRQLQGWSSSTFSWKTTSQETPFCHFQDFVECFFSALLRNHTHTWWAMFGCHSLFWVLHVLHNLSQTKCATVLLGKMHPLLSESFIWPRVSQPKRSYFSASKLKLCLFARNKDNCLGNARVWTAKLLLSKTGWLWPICLLRITLGLC